MIHQPGRAEEISPLLCHLDSPDRWIIIFTFLQDCAHKEDLPLLRHLHSFLVQRGLDSLHFWAHHIVRLFASSGSLNEASSAFVKVHKSCLCTWNSIISCYGKNEDVSGALGLYFTLQQSGLTPDRVTYLTLLKAIGTVQYRLCRLIHDEILRAGIECEEPVGSALVDAYAKCGSLGEAHALFTSLIDKDVVSWGALITGYTQHECWNVALNLFEKMKFEGVKPDRVIYLSIIKACGHIGASKPGRLIHDSVLKDGLESDASVGNTLIDLYGRCGNTEEVFKVFTGLHKQDVVSWSNTIAGYVQNELNAGAFDLFQKMLETGCKPTKITFFYMLKACINVGVMTQGRLMHQELLESGLCVDLKVGNALIDMYSKLGSPDDAYKVFGQLPIRDIVSWGGLIAGYAQLGNCILMNSFFNAMQRQGLKPNDIILTSIIAAYTCFGLVEEANMYFKSSRTDYGLVPTVQLYSCMIDLFARTGCFEEAKHLFSIMPPGIDIIPLKSLISSCKTHGYVDFAEHCFEHVVEADPMDATNYMLLSRLYIDGKM